MEDNIEALKAQIAALTQQLEKKDAKKPVTYKVSPKGAISLYGMRRMPITLYRGELETILSMADELRDFIKKNESALAVK